MRQPVLIWFLLCSFGSASKRGSLLLRAPLLHKVPVQLPEGRAKSDSHGFDETGQDLSVKPGDDFFAFANGKYIADLKLPDDEASWGSFDMLQRQSLERVRGLLEEDMETGNKMGRFYASYMNKSLVDTLDASPIRATLAKVAAMRNAADYAALSGSGAGNFLPSPFGVSIGSDPKDINSYSVSVDQGGLGLPRDYYLKASFAEKKAAYKKYAADLLEMVGWPEHQKASDQILELEEALAKVSWSNTELRDPVKTYNPMADVADLQSRAPGFDWSTFLQKAGDLPRKSKLVVGALGGVVGIAKILGDTDISVLRSHAAFHFVSQVASILSDRFVSAAFHFSKALSGQKTLSPRWKRGVRSLNAHMGQAVGKQFTDKFFPASAKLQVVELTQQLKAAFKVRLSNVNWMTDATKQKALDKLASFSIEVGYPKKIHDYTSLRVDANDLYGNIERSIAFGWELDLGKLGKPVDRDEWVMTPQTVNAYNMPSFNQVVFPAAILQPPFFDPKADMAVNYGGIGAVIGHEMTHAFDDQGRHYNAEGKLEDWWTKADDKAFKSRAEAYANQFAKFDLGVPGAHIKPDLTEGEDIADLGGLTLALDAYVASCKGKMLSPPRSGIRNVFLGWAQVWREKTRPDALLNQLVSDPHPPPQARVDIPMKNIAAWYEAFDVQEGEKHYLPENERVVIW